MRINYLRSAWKEVLYEKVKPLNSPNGVQIMLEENIRTVVCSNCGKLKSILEFRQDKITLTYSTICEQCLHEAKTDETDDSYQKEETGYRLDYKARIKIHQDQIDALNKRKNIEKKLRAKKDSQLIKITLKKNRLADQEKKRRELYFAAQKAKLNKTTSIRFLPRESSNITAKGKPLEQPSPSDLKFIFIDGHTSTVGRSYASLFGRFRDYLGKSAPINTVISQHKNNINTSPNTSNATTKKSIPENNKLTENFIKNNLKKP